MILSAPLLEEFDYSNCVFSYNVVLFLNDFMVIVVVVVLALIRCVRMVCVCILFIF